MGVIMALQNPEAFAMPSLQAFLKEAFARLPEVFEGYEAPVDWLRENCTDPDVGIFLAMDDRMEFEGLLVMSAQGIYAFSPHPWVLYLYAEKTPQVKMVLVRSILEWMRARGYKCFRANNASPLGDEEFMDSFREATKGRVVGSVLEFEVGGD